MVKADSQKSKGYGLLAGLESEGGFDAINQIDLD